ncbi:hypothetical protein ACFWNT_47190 [Streptomyces sp. NPDC058409]|uniref:hypothetical protein n=1 Tax=Streptomyces sp. NPDC058409 TaxID=3346484 RepID=UPI0036586580
MTTPFEAFDAVHGRGARVQDEREPQNCGSGKETMHGPPRPRPHRQSDDGGREDQVPPAVLPFLRQVRPGTPDAFGQAGVGLDRVRYTTAELTDGSNNGQ